MRILVEVERICQTHIAACSPFQILNPGRSPHPIGLGDHHQRPVDNDGIPRKESPVVSGFKRNWIDRFAFEFFPLVSQHTDTEMCKVLNTYKCFIFLV